MAEDNTQPIIVKKINKASHASHGGAWKIAYADFVTAMMAFFLLMWLLGSTTDEQKSAISDYFNNPSPVAGPGGASTSMVKVGGGKDITYSAGDTKKGSNPYQRPKAEQPSGEVGRITQEDKQRLLDLKEELEQAIDASEALKPFKDQLLLEITKEGLRIQIIDKENRPMFASGSAVLQPYAEQIIKEIGKVINHVPNKISLSGHTDATPFSKLPGARYSNWELSADRSNASRRGLIDGGMDEGKVARVVGLSSFVLFDKQNPLNPVNRRISIIVLNKETEDAILHDEGKLDQTTVESSAQNKPQALPPAPESKPLEKIPNKPVTPSAVTPPVVPPVSSPVPVPTQTPPAKPHPMAQTTMPQSPPSSVVAKPVTTPPSGIALVSPPISTPVTATSLVPNVKPVTTTDTTNSAKAVKTVSSTASSSVTAKPTPTTVTPATAPVARTAKPAPAASAAPAGIVSIAPVIAPIQPPPVSPAATATAAAASAAAAAANQ